jgi:hypothetical protein
MKGASTGRNGSCYAVKVRVERFQDLGVPKMFLNQLRQKIGVDGQPDPSESDHAGHAGHAMTR